MKLTKEQILRYKKQLSFPAIGLDGQLKICQSKVLVVGAGGLGSPILLYLAAAGVGTIACIDFDAVESHNLHRQIIHKEATIGTLKVYSAAQALKELNTDVHFKPIADKVTETNIDNYITSYDIILDGTDNFKTRYIINDACVRQHKPIVYGSILNFEIQLAVFNYEGSKNLRDLFPEPPNPDQVPNCDLNGVMNTVPGILALMMVQETLKMITCSSTFRNHLLICDTNSWTINRLTF